MKIMDYKKELLFGGLTSPETGQNRLSVGIEVLLHHLREFLSTAMPH